MYTSAELSLLRNADPGAVLPGIDTPTGNPLSVSSLIAADTITTNGSAPYFYVPSQNRVIVKQAGAVLSGINFGTAALTIQANNVTVEDCTFGFTQSINYSDIGIYQIHGYSGAVVQNCSFTGTGGATVTSGGGDLIVSPNNITVANNTFVDTPGDGLDVGAGTITGNYFSGGGYLVGSHADAIWVPHTTGPVSITNNFIDWTTSPGTVLPNNAVRITVEQGSTSNVSVSGNYLIGGGYTVSAGMDGHDGVFSNISVTGNYIGFGAFGQFYPGWGSATTISGNTIFDYTNPVYSTQAWTAYQAAGVPTTESGGCNGNRHNIWNSVCNDDPLRRWLQYGSGRVDHRNQLCRRRRRSAYVGGQGANIFTYLAISDLPANGHYDLLSNFDSAKDVIDLSHIDADLTAAGVQNFTFIGAAAFSGAGAQVRYQQDPAHNVTYVEADLAGDSSADLRIEIGGLQTLTAANFALTAAQSTSDMTAGAAMNVSTVRISSGTEDFYTNVQGKPYTSFEALYTNSTTRVADDLNLGSSANELDLSGSHLTISRGSSAETLSAGALNFSLAYKPTETIQAGNAGSETFAFRANFGNETIAGFAASGTGADTIQLATSSFSYLNSSMTQAQDLAAVLNPLNGSLSTSGGNTTITNSAGDRLTLTGLTPSTIAANASQFHFV